MPHKGIKGLSSDEMSSLQFSQNGHITYKWANSSVLGHYGGHGETYSPFQLYTEFLFGDACSYPHWLNADGTLGSGTFGKIISDGTNWDISKTSGNYDNCQAGDIIDISGTTNYNARVKVASRPDARTIRIANTNNYAGESSGSINSADGWREEDSTTGTKYYPDIKYIAMIKTMGTDTLGNLIECEVSASSLDGSDLVRPDISSSYNPDQSPASNYILMFHGDELYGQFNRIAVYRTSLSAMHGKAIFTKGPSLK